MFNFNLKYLSSQEDLYNDFELLKVMYSDSFQTIEDDLPNKRLIFRLNLKEEFEIDKSMNEIINELKFNELFIDEKTIGLPWRVVFTYANGVIFIEVFIFWLKRQPSYFDNLNLETNTTQESIFFSCLESIKNELPKPDKSVILNWLQEMKERSVITNLDIYSLYDKNNIYEYEDYDTDSQIQELSIDRLKLRSDKLLEKNLKKKLKDNYKESNIAKKEPYDLFFEEGGIVGEVISDRGSTFQAHAIKITKLEEIKKYLSLLKTNNKIFKAAHNIYAYRILEKKDITEGFEDDGEDGAGTRMLGILQKLKVVNVFVVVSRWFGGTLLGNDRFKHINDTAKELILCNKNKFEYSD
jgi:hypothetical protein